MPGYFGGAVDPNVGYSEYSGVLHYEIYNGYAGDTPAPEAHDNNLTIELVQASIHNMHPEQMSALADEWHNVHTFLLDVHKSIYGEASALADKHWKSSQAKAAFLKRGPGDALAYLDRWIDTAMTNVNTLRHLALISQQARVDIDALVAEFQEKLKNDQDVNNLKAFLDWEVLPAESFHHSQQRQIHDKVSATRTEYDLKARHLASQVANDYTPYNMRLIAAPGPAVLPMNAVIDSPHNPVPGFNGPGPGAPPPAINTKHLNLTKPKPAPPPNLKKDAPTPPELEQKDPVPDPADAPPVPDPSLIAPPAAPPVAPPAAPPVAPPLPPPPVAFAGPLPPPAAKSNFFAKGGPAPANAPNDLHRPGAAPSDPPALRSPSPGQLTRNNFQRPNSPSSSTGQPPGKTLRRPNGESGEPGRPGSRDLRRGSGRTGSGSGEEHQPGRPGERRRGDRAENKERAPGSPIDGEEAFGRPTGGSTPPVLKNPTGDRSRRRPGSAQELRPGVPGAGEALRPDGTSSPVLNRPARSGGELNPPRKRRSEQERRPVAPTAEWVGVDEARAAGGQSVIDAPMMPPSGARASSLEEIPEGLRSRAATAAAAAERARTARPGTVSPELSKRHTDQHHKQHPVDDEAHGVITDEQAFEVATPGGGVVTSKRDDQAYEPEVRRALGGH